MTIHVIPVPAGLTPEEAFYEIWLLGCLSTEHANDPCTWAVMETPDDLDAEEEAR